MAAGCWSMCCNGPALPVSLWLDVLKSNSGARRFYESAGLRQVDEVPFSTDLEQIGMWVMACDLPRTGERTA